MSCVKTILSAVIVCSTGLSVPLQAQADEKVEAYKNDYPGCVEVVKNQLALFDEATRVGVMPYLMQACMSGRQIGEKRTKEMYNIPTDKKPQKTKNFKIEVKPPSLMKQDPFEVQY
ncbi:hypothetical protein [Terasakiella pusilla]|jgi:hypothetical protein|uniref:hypothetical protein n=1 Tax=Terasakiella pusilla TaxID=64973 RepID=UPI000490DA99|nr:hypothetical protein [Terasakiella pusilla]